MQADNLSAAGAGRGSPSGKLGDGQQHHHSNQRLQLATGDGQGAGEPLLNRGPVPRATWTSAILLGSFALAVFLYTTIDLARQGPLKAAIISFLEWTRDNGTYAALIFTAVYAMAAFFTVPGTIFMLGVSVVRRMSRCDWLSRCGRRWSLWVFLVNSALMN